MKICIIGTGYVGLVTGACFAEAGNTVYCVDIDQNKIALLNAGHIPIYEPGLETLVKTNGKQGRLIFTTDLSLGINEADVSFIAVGTPQDKDGSADLQFVFQVCENICAVAKKRVVIATKSTVPVSTGDKIEALFKEKLKQDFVVFSNPEFLKEGDAINDFMKPDRIIVGTNDDGIVDLVTELYAPFNRQSNRLVFMNRRSAEITKYAANAMLALRISFMNELANFCDAAEGNINDVRRGIGSDPRIGPEFLYPGIGFGGSCFPKDVNALARAARDVGIELKTVTALNAVNEAQPRLFFSKILKSFGGDLKGRRFAVWGLAFKAKTDDIRCSPALELIRMMTEAGASVCAFDPQALDNVKVAIGDTISYGQDKMACANGADALVIATDWNEFKSPDFAALKKSLKSPKIFDGRNLYDGAHLRELGFEYAGIGVG
jgi:UDPglucose 6-dehydrogenase